MSIVGRILRRAIRVCLPARVQKKIWAFETDFRQFRYHRRNYWAGVYNSFDEAPVFGDDYYNSDEWISSKAETIRDLLSTPEASVHTTEFSRTLVALALSAVLSERKSKGNEGDLRILDVGGDAGSTYAILKASLNPDDFAKISYTVLELERCVQDGRKIWDDLGKQSSPYKISFSTEFPVNASGIDFIYFASSLQYFEDYKGVINQAIEAGPEYMFFFNTFIGNTKTHCTLQINVPGVGLAVWKINLDEFLEIFKNKYRLIYKSSVGANYNVDNFEPGYRLTSPSNLLLRRID